MASGDLSDERILEALRAIPVNLHGITWLTNSQLELVARVTETARLGKLDWVPSAQVTWRL